MNIKLKSNEFWGLRAGYYDPRMSQKTGFPNGFRIDISKWGQGKENNRAASKKARRNKNYANPKLNSKNYSQNK